MPDNNIVYVICESGYHMYIDKYLGKKVTGIKAYAKRVRDKRHRYGTRYNSDFLIDYLTAKTAETALHFKTKAEAIFTKADIIEGEYNTWMRYAVIREYDTDLRTLLRLRHE
jgi:hypothetical protein